MDQSPDDVDLRNDIDEVAALIVTLDAVAASRSWIPILAGAFGVPAYRVPHLTIRTSSERPATPGRQQRNFFIGRRTRTGTAR